MRQITNTNAHYNANRRYWQVDHEGVEYLFTDSDLTDARDRAVSNEEDLLPPEIHPCGFGALAFVLGVVLGLMLGASL